MIRLTEEQTSLVIDIVFVQFKAYCTRKESPLFKIGDSVKMNTLFNSHPVLVNIIRDIAVASIPVILSDSTIKSLLEIHLEAEEGIHKEVDINYIIDFFSNLTVGDVRGFVLPIHHYNF